MAALLDFTYDRLSKRTFSEEYLTFVGSTSFLYRKESKCHFSVLFSVLNLLKEFTEGFLPQVLCTLSRLVIIISRQQAYKWKWNLFALAF